VERKIIERLIGGYTQSRICEELGVSRRRVIDTRDRAREAGYLDGTPLPAFPEALYPESTDRRSERGSKSWAALTEHLPWLREKLDGGWHAVTVFEELAVKVTRSSFYRFLRHHELLDTNHSLKRVVPEIVHAPGEALLIDWGYLWSISTNGGRQQKVWVFLGVLGYSRFMIARVMTACGSGETLQALGDMYQELGGVPRRTTSDNPKVFALRADRYEALLNPVYERFASHYQTMVECLPPRSPEKKGKVERPMPYIRRLLEAYDGDRSDIEAIQRYLTKKLEVANQRTHGTTRERPCDRFQNEEQRCLGPLPTLSYEIEHYHEGTVRVDGHVRFLGKYYSVAENFIREPVTVIGNSTKVTIYHKGTLIDVHDRLTDRARSKSTKRHHLKPWEQACDNPDGLRGMAEKIGPAVEAVVHRILKRGDGFIDFRRIWGILSLEKKYTAHEIDTACLCAIASDDISLRFIERSIEDARAEAEIIEPPPVPRTPAKFERSMSEYSQLLLNLNQGEKTYEH
jgi:hypothetical protein